MEELLRFRISGNNTKCYISWSRTERVDRRDIMKTKTGDINGNGRSKMSNMWKITSL